MGSLKDYPPVLNQKLLAEVLGVNVRTCRRMNQDGRTPPPMNPGSKGQPRWSRDRVEAWLKGQKVAEWATAKPTAEEEQAEATVALLKSENQKLRKRITNVGSIGALVTQAVEDALADYRAPAVKAPTKARANSRRESEEAVLHISDVQWGKVTRSYDSAVARERIDLLAKKVTACIERHRSYADIDTLHIYLGGDIVEGESIFPHQAHVIDSPVIQQACLEAPDAISGLVLSLAEVVHNVKVAAVRGNHGRTAPRSVGANPRSNWDSVCYITARILTLGSARFPSPLASRVEWVNSDSFYHIQEVAGWHHMLVHGDQIAGWGGIPAYGINRRAAKWALSVLREMKRAGIPDTWDALYLGHFHTYSQGFVVDRPWYLNGTTESDNEFALEAMGEAGSPVQRLQFWSREHGMVADRPIYLDRSARTGTKEAVS